MSADKNTSGSVTPTNFIRQIIDDDLTAGRHTNVVTRFPPEPNGHLHIGHAKAICVNFGLAADYNGKCHLRMDDTNPAKESNEYIEAIQRDIRWLGFEWDNFFHAADYFDQLYEWAEHLIKNDKAYVCHLTADAFRECRGTVGEDGTPSPYRARSPEENLDLFRRMKAGEFPDGHCVLRAKIDMTHPNMLMRDPPIYRIRHIHHHRTGDKWCIYPLYDYTHGLSDALEGITHSVCTLEFDNNRALYDWFVDNCPTPSRPHQYEMARLNLTYCMMSKRNLLQLVEEQVVTGWDDPRMPTISGFRRRGYTPASIRNFCERIGVAKANSTVDWALLEHSLREDLETKAPRMMAVLDPLEVVIENYPEDQEDWLDAPFFPEDDSAGTRRLPFSKTLYIDRADFMENPPKKFYRLAPGREVRLRYGYFITCTGVEKDASGEITRLICSYDPATKGGNAPDGRRVKATLHWVSAPHAFRGEVRLYDRFFQTENPMDVPEGGHWKDNLNPKSLTVLEDVPMEPALGEQTGGRHVQFERVGYFFSDPEDSVSDRPVFNRTASLKDAWARMTKREQQPTSPAPNEAAAPARASKGGPHTPAERTLSAEDAALAQQLAEAHGLDRDQSELIATTEGLEAFFNAAVATHENGVRIASWIVNILMAEIKEQSVADLPFTGESLGHLVAMLDADTIGTPAAKRVFATLLSDGGDPREIVAAQGLEQISDPAAIAAIIDEVMSANGGQVAAYRAGKTKLLGFFVGQVMGRTQGKANPQIVRSVLGEKLNG